MSKDENTQQKSQREKSTLKVDAVANPQPKAPATSQHSSAGAGASSGSTNDSSTSTSAPASHRVGNVNVVVKKNRRVVGGVKITSNRRRQVVSQTQSPQPTREESVAGAAASASPSAVAATSAGAAKASSAFSKGKRTTASDAQSEQQNKSNQLLDSMRKLHDRQVSHDPSPSAARSDSSTGAGAGAKAKGSKDGSRSSRVGGSESRSTAGAGAGAAVTKRSSRLTIDPSAIEKYKKRVQRSRKRVSHSLGQQHQFQKPVSVQVRTILLETDEISLQELAKKLAIKVQDLIARAEQLGVDECTADSIVDQDTANILVEELGHKVLTQEASDKQQWLESTHQLEQFTLSARAPIVTIMGHVDHGKTTLLDYLRKTRVADGESGGITQHVGAYQVFTQGGQAITFIDTPGHELFSQMRAQGASLTDIVVLVVAADDGVKPQTIEAIAHAKAADVPIVTAITKIDKPDADLEKIYTQLANHEVLVEQWGGDVVCVPVSAKSGENIDKLIESILLQGEILELKSTADGPAVAKILEKRIDKKSGVVVSAILLQGTLKARTVVLCDQEVTRVRVLNNDIGQPITEVNVSQPFEMFGLSQLPSEESSGLIISVTDEKRAKQIAQERTQQQKESKWGDGGEQELDIEALLANTEKEEVQASVIIKSDVAGSAHALVAAVSKLKSEYLTVKIVHQAVGAVNESDVHLAKTTNALIVNFNQAVSGKIKKMLEEWQIVLVSNTIIYEVIDQFKRKLLGKLQPEKKLEVSGRAMVKELFNIDKVGLIAGSVVQDGIVRDRSPYRVLRDGVEIHQGRISSLRHHKEKVPEIKSGSECGIGLGDYTEIAPQDIIESLAVVDVEFDVNQIFQ